MGDGFVDQYLAEGAVCNKCHDMEVIDCTYCFCPLYHTDCDGNYKIMAGGVKDCSDCTVPHTLEFVENHPPPPCISANSQ